MKIKLDKDAVFGLCNSLNALAYPMSDKFSRAADVMLQAQKTITALYEELENEKMKNKEPKEE